MTNKNLSAKKTSARKNSVYIVTINTVKFDQIKYMLKITPSFKITLNRVRQATKHDAYLAYACYIYTVSGKKRPVAFLL